MHDQALRRVGALRVPALDLGHPGRGRQQFLRIGVGGRVDHLVDGADLHNLTLVHHHYAVAQVGDHCQIVGDEDHRHAHLGLELFDDRQDLGLDRHVQRSRRLVGNQDVWLVEQRHGDHDPLAHTTGKLVRVLVKPLGRVGNGHLL